MEPVTNKKNSVWPYAISAVVLMLILTGAILTPDYFNYSLRIEEIKNTKASKPLASPTPSPASQQNAIPTPNILPSAMPTELQKPALDSAQIFETYGKLLTMLLGFVSVLGVFVGYFIRKSLREIQDDIYLDVEKRMKLWEQEKLFILKDLEETRKKFEGMTALHDESKKVLKTLTEIMNTEQAARQIPTISTASVADSLDADITLNPPQNAIPY